MLTVLPMMVATATTSINTSLEPLNRLRGDVKPEIPSNNI